MSAATTPCQVVVWPLGCRCGETPAQLCRITCVHEHIRDRWICSGHKSDGGGACRACFEADGHVCPITIMSIPAVTS